MEPGDTIIDGGNSYYKDDVRRAESSEGQGHPLCRRRHQRRRLGHRARLLPDGRRPEGSRRSASIRSSRRSRPGSATSPAPRAARARRAPREEGYLHCGPSGAGHFVKMVHNGIEYGLMQAYAEGFDIMKNANSKELPEDHRYQFDLADIAEVWRRGSVVGSWLLDLTAMALTEDPELSQLHRHRPGFRRRPLDHHGRDRRSGARAMCCPRRSTRASVRARTTLSPRSALRHAQQVRRPRRARRRRLDRCNTAY